MGVITRDRGQEFVITSDRALGEPKNTRAAKRISGTYLVWTGDIWSSVMTEAKVFPTEDAADEYIRANYERVMRDG